MNRSYSKIRHIQEANQRLENRLLNEQTNLNTNTGDELWRQVVSKVGDSKWTSIVDTTPNGNGYAFIGDKNGKKIHVYEGQQLFFGLTVKPVNGNIETEEDRKLSDVVKSLVSTLDQSKNQGSSNHPEEFKYYPLVASDVDKVVEVINKLIPILKF
jgi:hypothetical protein